MISRFSLTEKGGFSIIQSDIKAGSGKKRFKRKKEKVM